MKKILCLLSFAGIFSCQEKFNLENYDNTCSISEETYINFYNAGISYDLVNSFESSLDDCESMTNKDILLVDYTKSIFEKRLYVVSYSEGIVKYVSLVSHARKSGIKFADSFSNVPDSNFSVTGLFKIHEKEIRTIPPYSYPIDGLEENNSNTFSRNITIHQTVLESNKAVGYSQGCFSITKEAIEIFPSFDIENSYLYVYYEN